MASNASIKVFIKIRPLINREKAENASSVWHLNGNTLKSTDKQYELSFDHIYDETKTTQELFEELAKPIVTSTLKGINGTIFAYGQTASGKTYTMMGDEENPGIIPLSVSEIFSQIESNSEDRVFLVRIGYIEIYNEKIFDLLEAKKPECTKVHESATGEISVQQREFVATSAEEILQHYEEGNKNRRVGETNMNDRSSRSHTIFRITIESRETGKTSDESAVQVSNFNLVDLAGSERANQTKADGERLKEGGHINKSLLALGNVIRVLSDENLTNPFINYRDSKLTRILTASLGGNAMTSIICTVTPAALDETFSTLTFASNAKKIKNKPTVNEVLNEQTIMKRMQREIHDLKSKLEDEKSRNSTLQMIQSLKQQIMERESSFVHSHNQIKAIDSNRRRTWCPSTTIPSTTFATPRIPVRRELEQLPTLNPFFIVPLITNEIGKKLDENEFDHEVFTPAEDNNFDRTLSPGGRSTDGLTKLIGTPREFKLKPEFVSPSLRKGDTPENLQARITFLEEELQELNDFKKIETVIGEDHRKLTSKLETANNHIANLEMKIDELQELIKEQDSDAKVKQAMNDRDKAIKSKTTAESIQASVEYEFETFKQLAKKREQELIQYLDEARKESDLSQLKDKIHSLEEQLEASETHVRSLLSNQAPVVPDLLSVDNNSLTSKIEELENDIRAITSERNNLRQGLIDKKNELARLSSEFEDVSTNLMDALQDTENLQKKIDDLELLRQANEEDVFKAQELNLKGQMLDEVLLCIKNEEEVPALEEFADDDTFQTVLHIHSEMIEWKQIGSSVSELHAEIDNLRRDNELLASKLPTIEESFVESENELKDRVDKLNFDLEASEETCQRLREEIETLKSDDKKVSTDENVNELQEKLSAAKSTEANLLKSLEQHRADLKEKTATIKQLEDDIGRREAELTSEIAELKEGLTGIMSLGEENQRLKSSEKDFKRVLNELTAKIQELEEKTEEVKAAKGLAEVQLQRIQKLETDENQMKTRLQQLDDDLANKVQTIAALETDVQIKDKKLEIIEQEALHLKQEKLNLEDELQQSQEKLKSTQQELDEKISELQSASKSSSNEFESLAQTALVEQEIADLTEKLRESTERVDFLELELRSKAEATDGSIQQISTFEKEVQALQEEVSVSKERVAQTALVEQEIADLTEKLREATERVNFLELELRSKAEATDGSIQQISTLEKEVQALQEEANVSKERAAQLEFELQNLRDNRADDSQSKPEELKTSQEELAEKLLVAEKSLKQLSEDLKESNISSDHLTGELEVFKQKYEDLQELNVSQADRIQSLQAFIDEKNLEIQELQKNIEASSKDYKEIENLKMQASAADEEKQKLVEAEAQVESLKIEVLNLTKLLEETHLKNEELQQNVSRLDELTSSLEDVKQQLADSQEEKAKTLAEQNVELEAFKEEFKFLQKQLADTDEKASQLESMESQIEALNSEILSLTNRLLEAENLKNRSEDSAKQLEQLEVELETLNNAKKAQDEEFVELSGKVAKLETQLNESNERYSTLEENFTTIEAENTKLKAKLETNEEEALLLKNQLQERTNECDEVKTRYRRRSCDTDKKFQLLESEKNELMQQVGACEAKKVVIEQELQKLKCEHLHVIEHQLPKLQSEIEYLKNQSNDNDMKYSVLDEKHSQLSELNQKLKAELREEIPKLEAMLGENEKLKSQLTELNDQYEQQLADLNDQLTTQSAENFNSAKIVAILKEERDSLVKQLEVAQSSLDDDIKPIRRKTASPDAREKRVDELFASQKQQILMEGHRATPTRASEKNVERKNRRQSVHDERRRLSAWEKFSNAEVQTEAVDEKCACAELSAKVKELQIEVRKRDCKLSTMERLAQHNPLKLDLEEAKKALAREQRDHNHTRGSLDVMSRNMIKLESKIEILSKNQKSTAESITRATQARDELTVQKADFEQLEKKCSELKRINKLRQERIFELENNVGKEKENVSTNINKSPEIRAIEQENSVLKKKLQEIEEKSKNLQTDDGKASTKLELQKKIEEFETLKKKYDMTRRLCNLRNDDNSKLRERVSDVEAERQALLSQRDAALLESRKIKEKYILVKGVCESRFAQIGILEARLAGSNEAVPSNKE